MSRGRAYKPKKQDEKKPEKAHETNKDEAKNKQTITNEQYEELMKRVTSMEGNVASLNDDTRGTAINLDGMFDYFSNKFDYCSNKAAAHEGLIWQIINSLGDIVGVNLLNTNETKANVSVSGANATEAEPI